MHAIAKHRVRIQPPTVDDMLHKTPDQIFGKVEQELERQERQRSPKLPSVNVIVTEALVGPGGLHNAPVSTESAHADDALIAQEQAAETEKESFGHWDRLKAGMAETVMGQIIEHGEAIRGWLGIEIQTLTPELAESFGITDSTGLVVAGVLADGPAARAGVRPGDVVTRIDGRPVPDARTALNLIAQTAPGSAIQLHGLRDGKSLDVTVTASKRPQPR